MKAGKEYYLQDESFSSYSVLFQMNIVQQKGGIAMKEVQQQLFALQDIQYKSFIANLTLTVPADKVIGIRTPALRSLAKQLLGTETGMMFLDELPHEYFEENQLHAFMISEIRNYDQALERVRAFLPYVDNWATCDQMIVKVFKKDPERLLPYIDTWLCSDHPYTVRYGIECLMKLFLDGKFDPVYPERVSRIRSDDYYVNMMAAWYFAEALAKQYDTAITYIRQYQLPEWVHNKTIQKACESYRISDERKQELRQYRIMRSGR